MANDRTSNYNSAGISREALADVAYMCYVLNRTEMTRWYHQWRTVFERMANRGWTVDGLEHRGIVRKKLELAYGLTPMESRAAVRKFPLINMGIDPWQAVTDETYDELVNKIFRAYAGLTPEAKHHLCRLYAEDDNADGQHSQVDCEGSCDMDMSYADDSSDEGGFYFI